MITEEQLAEKVGLWQSRLALLGIGHFRVECVSIVDETPAGAGPSATAGVHDDYDSVYLWFKRDYLEDVADDRLEMAIIHEWLHAALRDLDQALERAEDWMPPQTYRDFEANIEHEVEGLIERLARLIYALYSNS